MAPQPSLLASESLVRAPRSLHALLCGLALSVQALPGQCQSETKPTAPQVVIDRDLSGAAESGHHHAATRAERFLTSRQSQIDLVLPDEEDAFVFAVFGDRTGGPAEGIEVLKEAVADTNLLDPDLVMTVGDLIQGYNQTPEWLEQMREFKGAMDKLDCPWFPVAGNHDVYWRGPNKPAGEHEKNYELHFGPLWYAFEHKESWFVVLYSDEGDPETGEKTFSKPAAQRVSPEQFAWLDRTLKKTATGKHTFVFLHHPRWHKGKYGDDWDRIHKRLVETGNVRAVFAGHEHRMVYDGGRDGIEYLCLATVGGHQNGHVPEAGWLHHFDIVTVRDDKISIAALPVGTVIDPRKITQEVNGETVTLSGAQPSFDELPLVTTEGSAKKLLKVTYQNPTSRPVDIMVRPDSPDSRWESRPDHRHAQIPPGESATFEFHVSRSEPGFGKGFRQLSVVAARDYLAEGVRIRLPEQRVPAPVRLDFPSPEPPKGQQVLALDGDDALMVASSAVPLPQGAVTLEGWFKADKLFARTGLVTKTERSEYGLFIIDNKLRFDMHLNGRYVSAIAEAGLIKIGQWYHIAGVYDGKQLRLYVDGLLVASEAGSGRRTTNGLPLVVGGDVASNGQPTSMFTGTIDSVRLSNSARYSGEQFRPARDFEPDEQSLLLLPMNGTVGAFHLDASGRYAHPIAHGNPALKLAP